VITEVWKVSAVLIVCDRNGAIGIQPGLSDVGALAQDHLHNRWLLFQADALLEEAGSCSWSHWEPMTVSACPNSGNAKAIPLAPPPEAPCSWPSTFSSLPLRVIVAPVHRSCPS